ncbi:hypothetical protein AVEN_144684-1 [Araneus ventricosus]|uniref:Uncharacterized protein n=1 Tax=Araneus ventricosus TaxID=182803 RepID=A0A4Y2I6L4_ARAVE|nr:hypothetical protein AVEN_144684-1 [Araneus ventricosus]
MCREGRKVGGGSGTGLWNKINRRPYRKYPKLDSAFSANGQKFPHLLSSLFWSLSQTSKKGKHTRAETKCLLKKKNFGEEDFFFLLFLLFGNGIPNLAEDAFVFQGRKFQKKRFRETLSGKRGETRRFRPQGQD